MAKSKAGMVNGPELFRPDEAQIRQRAQRRQRALFIPHLLRTAMPKATIDEAACDRAYQIALRWAALEDKGALAAAKETDFYTQYLDQLFGEGLGYALESRSPDKFQLRYQYSIPEGGAADAALGDFPAASAPVAVIEMKGANVDLDRDRSQGRTAVLQCWDYLTALPGCPWGIVSNFSTIRLYHRDQGRLAYEEFTLQELKRRDRFNEFYFIFQRDGLLVPPTGQKPRALALLEATLSRQREVGNELYESYRNQRLNLIEHFHKELDKPFDVAVRMAQKLLDRVLFIAFCEDRGLLPPNLLKKTFDNVPPLSRATNPRWKAFLDLFHAVDKGHRDLEIKDGYNGNLFKHDPEVDDLELADMPWTQRFSFIGNFDFSEEVNVDVLGHVFERSITELERLRPGGLFALKAAAEAPQAAGGKMPKSAQRKRFGIYYTPPAFTALLVERTVDALVEERFEALRAQHGADSQGAPAYWLDCIEALKAITVCDPACGSGAFLIRAYDALDAHYKAVVHGLAGAGQDEGKVRAIEDAIPDMILEHNLFGVDQSREAVEITQLALWIRSARRNRKLSDLSGHIVCGNSLVDDPAVDRNALDWRKAFPQVFEGAGGFSCVIGNPPWEQLKVQAREFFGLPEPTIAAAQSSAQIDSLIEKLRTKNPELYGLWEARKGGSEKLSEWVRTSGRYPLTGRGHVNLAMLFTEASGKIVSATGLVGLLVPSGLATDEMARHHFNHLMEDQRLISLYDFENKLGHFEDVHRAFKFTALVFGGTKRVTGQADFVFFAREVEETKPRYKQRHISLTAADLKLLNPNTRTCPIFRTRRDAELTKAIYKRVPILIDENRQRGGNPWGIKFLQMFNQATDSSRFLDEAALKKRKAVRDGNRWSTAKESFAPVYEAKMVQAFDHRAASVFAEDENWARTGQKAATTPVEHQNPEFQVTPRWWVNAKDVREVLKDTDPPALLAYKDVTSPTNERTMIAAYVPVVGVVHSAPLVLPDAALPPRLCACLLANFNAFVYDFVARQKVGGLHLSYFIVEQLPTLPPDAYAETCPWSKKETLEQWISERVLKLTCTAEDMIPLAKACGFKGSRGDGVHLWKEAERAQLRAELDAAFFILYEIERADAEYILSTFSNTGLTPAPRTGQTYMIQPESTADRILAAYDRLSGQ